MPAKHASTVSVAADGLGLYCSGRQMQNLTQNFAQDPAAHLSATQANMKAEDKNCFVADATKSEMFTQP